MIDRFSSNPALDRKSLLNWIVFNYFIHNADAHAKNLSLLLTPNEVLLAPFYDLMCTGVYDGVHEKLAMKIGNENHPQWIKSRHWIRMAESIGIGAKFVLRTVNEIADQIETIAHKLASEQESQWGSSLIVKKILDIISKQVRHAKSANTSN